MMKSNTLMQGNIQRISQATCAVQGDTASHLERLCWT